MELRAPLRLALACLIVPLVGCGPSAPALSPLAVEAPAHVLERAPWECDFAPSELVVHRSGRVVAMAEEGDGPGDERPLRGIRVELLAPRPSGLRPLTVVATAETDAHGRFTVGPGPANRWVLRAVGDGWTTTVGGRYADVPGVVPLIADGPLTMPLRPSVTRLGRLLDEAGEPVPDEPLVAFGEAYHEEARTGADGRFVIRPPAELIQIETAGERYLRMPARVNAESREEIVLRAKRRGVVRGTVVESETRRPLAGALVAWDGLPHVHTKTDATGRFELAEPRGRPTGAYAEARLAAFAVGWGWRSMALPVAGEVEIRLRPGQRAWGRVVHADGSPVAGARILATSPSWDRNVELVRGPLTGPDGTFDFDWLPSPPRGARDPLVLVAHRRGAGTSEAARRPADESRLELELSGERIVRGRLARESGTSIPEAVLEVTWDSWKMPAAGALRLPVMDFVDGATRSDGSFEMHGVPLRREARLRVIVDGGSIDKTLPADDTAEVLVVLDGGGVVAGRIVNSAGEVLDVSGTVTAYATDHDVFANIERSTVIEGGVFRLEDLPDAEYTLTAYVPELLVLSKSARVGDELDLVGERFARLVVRTVFPDGAEPEPITVRYLRAGAAGAGTRLDVPAGTREASRRLEAGIFDVTASGGVWRAHLDDVRIAEGEERVVELELERTRRVRARLFDADGSPLPGGRVRLVSRDPGRKPEQHYSDIDGWLDLTGLTDGEWEVRVVMQGRAPLRRTIRADAVRGDLELRLPPHGALQIEARTATGAPAAGAVIDLADEDGNPVLAWGEGALQLGSRFGADDSGRVLVRGVRAGKVVVRARRARLELGRAEADVVAGKTTEVTMN